MAGEKRRRHTLRRQMYGLDLTDLFLMQKSPAKLASPILNFIIDRSFCSSDAHFSIHARRLIMGGIGHRTGCEMVSDPRDLAVSM